MAVANTKSTQITNGDSTPVKMTSVNIVNAREFISKGMVEVAAADDNASVYRLVRVPSNAYIHSIRHFNDAITSLNSADLGVYQTAENGGAVVDADFFGSAIDLSSLNKTGTEIAYEANGASQFNIDMTEKPLWQALGLTSDPGRDYDICFTAGADPAGAGTVVLHVRYTGPG